MRVASQYFNYLFCNLIITIVIVYGFSGCDQRNPGEGKIIFYDDFGAASQGELVENVIQLPPPQGLGYDWKVLPDGYLPVKWIHIDELEPSDPKKGFWVIPPDSGYIEQGGRSHNSVLFANVAIPEKTENFDIFFRQLRGDNDYIGYLIGLPEPALEGGIEFGYMIQVPGTDSTTVNAYVQGDLGELVVPEMAFQHQWANHQIKVRGDSISWYQEGKLMVGSVITGKSKTGYFGIRQRYERGTRYDDLKIVILK